MPRKPPPKSGPTTPPPAPKLEPGIKANRYEMVFTCVVGDSPVVLVGGPIVRDVAPIYVRYD